MMIINMLLMASPQGGQQSNPMVNMGFIVLMVIVFYFFMIRPQMKKAKEQKKFREGLKKGDKIVTIGGLHGKIAEIHDTTIIIETETGIKLKFEKSAVSLDQSVSLGQQP
jgi:preprotein translocase subunit YajC